MARELTDPAVITRQATELANLVALARLGVPPPPEAELFTPQPDGSVLVADGTVIKPEPPHAPRRAPAAAQQGAT